MDGDDKQLAFSILEWLRNFMVKYPTFQDAENIDVAFQCLSTALNVDVNNLEHRQQFNSIPSNLTLSDIFKIGLNAVTQPVTAPITTPMQVEPKDKLDQPNIQPPKQEDVILNNQDNEFEKKFQAYIRMLTEKNYFGGHLPETPEYITRYQRAREKFIAAKLSKPAASTINTEEDKAQRLAKAEKFKTEGNQQVSARQYEEAIKSYTASIELNPDSAIYYSNRAAAYSMLGDHQKAVEDSIIATQKDSTYTKAYSRLGLAYFSLGKYKEAIDAYRKAVELDPNNTALKDSLQAAEVKYQETAISGSNDASFDPSLLGNFGQLFNNPQMMNLAQQMMNNPALMNMANNIMQNPEALNNLLNNFGSQRRE